MPKKLDESQPPPQVEAVAAPESPDDILKRQAKDLYFAHKPKAEISRALGLSTRQLNKWAKEEEWALQREDEDRSLIEDSYASRKLTVSAITRISAEQIQRGLEHLEGRPDPPTLSELEKLATILGALDKVGRLDAGKSTENIAVNAQVKMTADEIRQVLTSDPFFSESGNEADPHD